MLQLLQVERLPLFQFAAELLQNQARLLALLKGGIELLQLLKLLLQLLQLGAL